MRREQPRGEAGPETGLTIRLFGGMAIRDSLGADFLPRSRKTRALVAILTLTAPRPSQRATLTGMLWSRRENEQARASLRQAVHELQETLGQWGHLLLAERQTLAFDLRGVTVDAIEANVPASPRIELLTMFQGGFLEDLAGLDGVFDAWLDKERRRLATAARSAGEAFLRTPHGMDETVAVARALLGIDRGHDGAWRALIQAHIDADDRTAARFACDQWRDAMSLGADQPPPAELAALLARIRTGSDAPPAIPVHDSPVLAGGVTEAPIAWPSPPPPLSSPLLPAPLLPPPRIRRPGLRLVVREMRVIGGNVDRSLSAGLTEEVTTALSHFRWISCVSGSSLAAMAGEAGEDNVRWSDVDPDLMLEGSIQSSTNRLRITVRLLDMRAGGAVIWSNRFDHDAGDLLAVQDGVAAAIVAQIDPVLLMREGHLAAGRGSNGASARDMVLRAVPAVYRLDRVSFHAAGELLEAALSAEPANSDALAWYAYWHLFLVGQGWAENPEDATTRAGKLADTAVAMDPNDARALTLAGHVRGFLMKRAAEAAVLHERAISLNPNLALAWCFSGFSQSYLGQQQVALRRMAQAIQLSPSDPHLFFFQGAIIMPRLLCGHYEEAAEAGRKAIELNPWFSSAFKGHLAVLGHLGHRDEAASVMTRLLKLEPRFTVQAAIRRSPMTQAEDVACYAEGLRRAGLPEN